MKKLGRQLYARREPVFDTARGAPFLVINPMAFCLSFDFVMVPRECAVMRTAVCRAAYVRIALGSKTAAAAM